MTQQTMTPANWKTALILSVTLGVMPGVAWSEADETVPAYAAPDQLLLKDYQPRSIFKIPQTRVAKARYPAIDMHSHHFAHTEAELDHWVEVMDRTGVQKVIILTMSVGKQFDKEAALYGKYPKRFETWCSFDFSNPDQPDYVQRALAELERCHEAGACGVGELIDKGRGFNGTTNRPGLHADDPRLDKLYEKCADLHMPVSIHVAEDQWMYERMDANNDGLMNGWKWRVSHAPEVMQHDELVATLEHAAKKHPRTIFIACHLANCCADLNRLGAMLEDCPNLYADIAARFAEIAPIPRFASQFFQKYQDRLVYATDSGGSEEMYRQTFRLLETADEHYYPTAPWNIYHWPWYGMALPDETLKKLYQENAEKILGTPPR